MGNANEQVTVLLRNADAEIVGEKFTLPPGRAHRGFIAHIAGDGAVSATVLIKAAAGPIGEVTLFTFSLDDTDEDVDANTSDVPWPEVWAEVTAISGTGAVVNVVMAS